MNFLTVPNETAVFSERFEEVGSESTVRCPEIESPPMPLETRPSCAAAQFPLFSSKKSGFVPNLVPVYTHNVQFYCCKT